MSTANSTSSTMNERPSSVHTLSQGSCCRSSSSACKHIQVLQVKIRMPSDIDLAQLPSCSLSSVLLAIQREEDSSRNSKCSPSEVTYKLLLDNGAIVILTVYLVYPEPGSRSAQQEPARDDSQPAAEFSWSLVTRGEMIVLM